MECGCLSAELLIATHLRLASEALRGAKLLAEARATNRDHIVTGGQAE